MVALFTIITLVFEQSIFADLPETLRHFTRAGEIHPVSGDFGLPADLGKVVEAWGGAPALVLIQDPHGHTQAQKKIQDILKFLQVHYGFQTLLVEGGVGSLDADFLRFFKEDGLNLEAADFLAREAEIGGPELFLLNERLSSKSDRAKPKAYGVENPRLYLDHLKNFQRVLARKSKTDPLLKNNRTRLENLAGRTLHPELLKFFKEWLSHEDDGGDLLGYLSELSRVAKKELGMDLRDPREQLDWPNLVRFHEIKNRESKVDPRKAEEERKVLSKWARHQKINPAWVGFLRGKAQRSGKFPGLRNFWESFFEKAHPLGFHFQDYPHLTLLEGWRVLEEEIESKELFGEIKRLSDRVLEKMAASPIEKSLIQQARYYLLLKKLFSLQLTREEFEKFQQEMKKGTGVGFRFFLPEALRFYKLALRRDRWMAKETLGRMRGQKIRRAVLIAGGFHTDGLAARFRAKNISYAVITPHMTEIGSEEKYQSSMMGKAPKVDFSQATLREATWLADWRGLLPETITRRRAKLRQAIEKHWIPKGATLRKPQAEKILRSLPKSSEGGRSEMRFAPPRLTEISDTRYDLREILNSYFGIQHQKARFRNRDIKKMIHSFQRELHSRSPILGGWVGMFGEKGQPLWMVPYRYLQFTKRLAVINLATRKVLTPDLTKTPLAQSISLEMLENDVLKVSNGQRTFF